MKRKAPLWTVALLATAAATVGSVSSYSAWKRQHLSRLQSGSSLIETTRGPIEYRQWGQGTAVLILHGTPGGYDQSLAFSKLLGSQHCTFIAISRPGYLRTPLGSARTPEEQADLYAALLDALDIQQAALIGISGGGPSALQFALRYPKRCSGLVMISGVATHYSELELRENWSPLKRFFNDLYSKLIVSDFLLYALLPFARLRPSPTATEELLHSVMLYKLRQAGYSNDMQQFAQISSYPLAGIAVPTLVVHGRADDEVPFAHAELVVKEVPHAGLVAVDRAAHLAFYTHADIVMPEVRAFLKSL